jgi:hypothetical protein
MSGDEERLRGELSAVLDLIRGAERIRRATTAW